MIRTPRTPPHIAFQESILRHPRRLDLAATIRSHAMLGHPTRGGSAVPFKQWGFGLNDAQNLQLCVANPARGYLLIINNGPGILLVCFGKRATAFDGVPIAVGDSLEYIFKVPSNSVDVLANGATSGLIVEG